MNDYVHSQEEFLSPVLQSLNPHIKLICVAKTNKWISGFHMHQRILSGFSLLKVAREAN